MSEAVNGFAPIAHRLTVILKLTEDAKSARSMKANGSQEVGVGASRDTRGSYCLVMLTVLRQGT